MLGELAHHAAGGRADRGRGEQRRREEADDEPGASADLTPLRPRWSPVSVTCTSPSASFWTRTTPSTVIFLSSASFSDRVEVLLGEILEEVRGDQDVLLFVAHVRSFLRVDRVSGERLVGVLV